MTKMTVKEFLGAGHKFVEGDVYSGSANKDRRITVGVADSVDTANTPMNLDDERLVIKAAALDNTVPQWNGEGLPPVGIECEVIFHTDDNPEWRSVKVLFAQGEVVVVEFDDGDMTGVNLNCGRQNPELRPLETPQQREEREKLEAAYDLYKSGMIAVNANYCDFGGFIRDYSGVYLAIVEKTGYRVTK